jgi:hypothetical protein
MRTVRLDKTIVSFVKKLKGSKRFGGYGTISQMVSEALKMFLGKHDSCLTCNYHKEQVARLELNKQKLALSQVAAGKEERPRGVWVLCPETLLAEARKYGVNYRAVAKDVVEQALLEHLTRPSQCQCCPFYEEMRKKIEEKYAKESKCTS